MNQSRCIIRNMESASAGTRPRMPDAGRPPALLQGKPVADAIDKDTGRRIKMLAARSVQATLATLRIGQNTDDISYEKGIVRHASELGIQVERVLLSDQVRSTEFFNTMNRLSHNKDIHGLLLFCPLPASISERRARNQMMPRKDVDGFSYASLTGVFCDYDVGFAPCTAQAAVELLDYYRIPIEGRRVVILGRSLVVGKPLSMLLTARNATVTLCHTGTVDAPALAREADILIAASGRLHLVGSEYLSPGQIVIDVGINWDETKQKIAGDVHYEEARSIVRSLTPVPGGVGSVTTAVLLHHVVEAAEAIEKEKEASPWQIFRLQGE